MGGKKIAWERRERKEQVKDDRLFMLLDLLFERMRLKLILLLLLMLMLMLSLLLFLMLDITLDESQRRIPMGTDFR